MGWQAEANSFVPLPIRDGVAPSYLWLPDERWPSLLAFLVARFPAVTESDWRERMARGEVVDGRGDPVTPATPFRKQMRIWYYRELPPETPIPFEEQVLHMDEHLLIVDKPHFLPMIPTGRFVKETLLVRLKHKLGLPDLVPIHRLDRETAGVVIFSHNRATRGTYQSMFQKRSMQKTYEALAAPIPGRRDYPFTYRSRMVDADQFFIMREEVGEPNSETVVDVIEERGDINLYRLQPHTGRKHQLRLHMASLGAPILNDAFYPVALPCKGDDFRHPLQLLARSITFTDPLSGAERTFTSTRTLE
ncbi:RluA family pseudouridine synthase [Pseudoduganella sp. GCM10020061]|uniref:RluA family pseudouridine synthase n=1 Tax=Pseudoduganella sp. GCM10020061 TaxID=3317345 RepID=UPI003634C2F4